MKQALAIVAVVVAIGIGWLIFGNKKDASPPSPSSSSSNSQSGKTNQTSQSTNPAVTDKVKIADMAFSPAAITIKKGTTVTWTNNDSVSHTVTENDGQNGPSAPPLGQDQSYTFKFDQAGTFHYHCSIHPEMTGTVTVTE
jgi:amicyanin